MTCGRCGKQLGVSRPLRHLIFDVARFSFNLSLLLLVPCASLYWFSQSESFRYASGFIFLFSLAIASVALHEFMHSLTAYSFGDYRILERGYLRLDATKYFRGLYSFAIPLFALVMTGIFIPGGAVLIDLDAIRKPVYRSIVYAAGVVANAVLLAILLVGSTLLEHSVDRSTFSLLQYAAFIQVMMIAFNLLPLPGLDGWGIISQFLPSQVRMLGSKVSSAVLLCFVASLFLYPPMVNLFGRYIDYSLDAVGLDKAAVHTGQEYLVIFSGDKCNICTDVLAMFTRLSGEGH